MSCCSNFDGFSDLEELEVSPYLDFDGEDLSIDEDFDDFFGKKARARRQERKAQRQASSGSAGTGGSSSGVLGNIASNLQSRRDANRSDRLYIKAKATEDYNSCLQAKPRLTKASNWLSACKRVHQASSSSSKDSIVDELMSDEPVSSGGGKSGLGAIAEQIKGEALGKADEMLQGGAGADAGAELSPNVEPKKAGLLANKGVLFAGGVIALGLGFLAYRRFKK